MGNSKIEFSAQKQGIPFSTFLESLSVFGVHETKSWGN